MRKKGNFGCLINQEVGQMCKLAIDMFIYCDCRIWIRAFLSGIGLYWTALYEFCCWPLPSSYPWCADVDREPLDGLLPPLDDWCGLRGSPPLREFDWLVRELCGCGGWWLRLACLAGGAKLSSPELRDGGILLGPAGYLWLFGCRYIDNNRIKQRFREINC